MKSRFNLALKYIGGNFKPQDTLLKDNHKKVMDHIKARKGVCKDLINDILFIKPIVADKHIVFCDKLLSEKVTLPVPIQETPAVLAYENVAPTKYGPYITKVPGCYRIFDSLTGRSYVGQSLHVGARVSDHANRGYTKTSISKWMSELNYENKGLVEVYRVPVQSHYDGLSLREFLCVMEMYLFLVYKPSENRILVSTPGKMKVPSKAT